MNLRPYQKQIQDFIITLLIIFIIFGFGCSKKETQARSETTTEIHWLTDLAEAMTQSEKQDKPLMIDFTAEWCPPCQKMEKTTFNQPNVIRKTNSFITLRIDVDKQGAIADKYNCNAGKYGGIGIPNILFMDYNENRIKHIIGYQDQDNLIAVMDSVLTMAKSAR